MHFFHWSPGSHIILLISGLRLHNYHQRDLILIEKQSKLSKDLFLLPQWTALLGAKYLVWRLETSDTVNTFSKIFITEDNQWLLHSGWLFNLYLNYSNKVCAARSNWWPMVLSDEWFSSVDSPLAYLVLFWYSWTSQIVLLSHLVACI